MNNSTMTEVLNNIALLFLLLSVHTLIPLEKFKRNKLLQILIGVSIGIVGIAIMSTPIDIREGVVLDTRSILISITGVFFGIIPTIISVIITSVYRMAQGGVGNIAGASVIVASGMLGLFFNYFRLEKVKHNKSYRWIELYLFGIVVHIVMFLCFFIMPFNIAVTSIRQTALPVFLLYPLSTSFIGILMFQPHDKILALKRLKKSETNYELLSYHDHLTGLKNRRYFEEQLIKLDRAENLPLSIIIGDLNNLKFMNDSFGHDNGDKLLVRTAKILEKTFTDNYTVSRYGGDEFIVLLPNTNLTQCESFINKTKERMKNEYIENINLSVSFGYASKLSLNTNVRETLKIAEDNMYREKLSEAPNTRGVSMGKIITTLYEKEPISKDHSKNVSILSVEIGTAMGLEISDIKKLRTTGLLHDIGKITISEDVLNKDRSLTESEYSEIKKHPEIGSRILKSSRALNDISDFVLMHHERWDGKGYPLGLKEDEIPIQSRIIAVADAYDAMTSERCYKDSILESDAIKELINNSGTQFDPEVVDVFVNKVMKSIDA